MTTVLDRLDAGLGKVPTYRLVAALLAGLAVLSLLFSVVGWVGFPLLDLVLTLVVAVGGSWLAARLLGAVARVPAHSVSAIVTGLLLYFLLFPSSEPLDLAVVAGAALVAAASKYLITVGGRHVLNPAAFAVFVAAIANLPSSAWWVATPALFPFVLLSAVLVAVRTRLTGTVLLFVAVATALTVVGQLRFGEAPLAALSSALLSTPILFLGAFMLTEPITLPSVRWQRLLEATVVGVLVALPYLAPFQLLTLTPTPEFALLVGNVLSLLLARPAASRMRFAGRRALTPTSTEFAFTPDRPIDHRPGQYLELQLPHRGVDRRGIRRTLTIVSPPRDESGKVKVALRTRQPMSSFKRALEALPVGSPVQAVTVGGAFTLPRDRSLPLLLVASGIGITPFVSQLQAETRLVAEGARPRDILVVDRVPDADELPYADVLEASGARVLVVCPEPDELAATGLPEHWHVAARFDAETLRGVLPDPASRVAYVSGSPNFIATAKRVLRATGVRRIRTDAFSGY